MDQASQFLTLSGHRDAAREYFDAGNWARVARHARAFHQVATGSEDASFVSFERVLMAKRRGGVLKDVELHLATNLTCDQGRVFSPDWRGDPLYEDYFRRRVFVHDGREAVIFAPAREVASGLDAIDLTHVWAHNWFHYLIEVLGLLADPQVAGDRGRILMNRSYLKGNFLSALEVLAPEHMARIVPTGAWGKVRCKTLLRPDGIWTPSHYHKDPDRDDHLHCGFSQPVAARAFYGKAWPGRRPEKSKIVIRRPESSVVRCINEDTLLEEATRRGYRAVSPEALTFRAQAALFYDADVIVGVSGAAFANLVFCRPHTRIVCARNEVSGNVTYAKLAEGFDLDFSYYDGTSRDVAVVKDHSTFEVDPTALLDMAESAG